MSAAPRSDTICILLATYNGATHLAAQLASLRAQTCENWCLWASDDGSTDETLAILEAFKAECPQEVRILQGPRQGVTANFMSLLCHAELPKGPVALCDQDDVWFDFKLERALAQLQGDGVALYCGRTEIGNTPDTAFRVSPMHPRPPAFRNALIQTLGGGNTMVLTRDAVDLVQRAGCKALPAYHDWWLYLLISGAGGRVVFDQTPVLFYRQHDSNHMGRNRGVRARYARLETIFSGAYGVWVDQNCAVLEACLPLLTPEHQQEFSAFQAMRNHRGLAALRAWRKLGLYRQGRVETILMASAAMRGKI